MNPIPSPESPALVIGAATIDIIGVLDDQMRRGISNPAHIRFSFGGVARNVAENLARLGHPVRLISAVGEDRFGEQLLDHTAAAGVDVSEIICSTDNSTGSYIGVVNQAGELQYALDDLHVIKTIKPQYLHDRYELFKQASVVFVDANLPPTTLRTAFSLARRAKIPVFADPTTTLLAHRLEPHLAKIFLIAPNFNEAAFYCDRTFQSADPQGALEAAKHLVSQGVQIAIVTLAESGVCYATSETNGYIPAIHTEIIDPTGGGDALTATVIFALLNEIPLDDAVRLGVSAASLTLRHRGAVLPDLSLEKLYNQLVI
ncbi:MAG TPA: ribokinase [Chloroflexi bacterium]|nr:ribokinase [Chloroflexota bacterium]